MNLAAKGQMNPCVFQSFDVIDKHFVLLEINNWVELGWVELIDRKRRGTDFENAILQIDVVSISWITALKWNPQNNIGSINGAVRQEAITLANVDTDLRLLIKCQKPQCVQCVTISRKWDVSRLCIRIIEIYVLFLSLCGWWPRHMLNLLPWVFRRYIQDKPTLYNFCLAKFSLHKQMSITVIPVKTLNRSHICL